MSRLQRTSSAARRLMLMWMSVITCVGPVVSAERVPSQASQGTTTTRQAVWPPKFSAPAPGEVRVLPVQGQVYMLVGAGGNITVQAGDDGILLVDTGVASMSDTVWSAIRTISRRPLRYIINTTEQADHAGGNATLAAKGEIVPWRAAGQRNLQSGFTTDRASVISYLTVFHRMAASTGQVAPTPEAAWPDNTYSTRQKELYFNGEPVVILHQPATTDGNSLVLFRKSDVVSAGDLLDLTGYPIIDLEAGGSIQAVVEGLNRLLEITVPAANAAAGTLVVPGHGRIGDQAEVAYYRDMIAIVRDRVHDMIRKGMTLEQVRAAKPTEDYDPRYGKATGAWTTNMFLEAAYQSLRK